MADAYPVDYTTDVGRVRKYIPDVTLLEDPADPLADPSYIWSDSAIQSFIDDELPVLWTDPTLSAPRTAIWRAAATAMIATANDVNLTLKKLVTEDLETDGPAVADKLIKGAQELLKKAALADNVEANQEVFFAVFPPADYVRPEGTEWPTINYWSTH